MNSRTLPTIYSSHGWITTNVCDSSWKVGFASKDISCILWEESLGASPVFYFQVKFYPPEPALLQEDLTRFVIEERIRIRFIRCLSRYQFCLQLRQDILSGK